MRTKTNRERNKSFKKEDKFNTKKVKFANKITEITSTIKYFLLRNINIKNAYILSALVISLVMLGGSYSYAMFTASVEKKGALNMVVGNLYSFIDSSDLTSAKTITPIIKPDVKGWLNVKLSNIYTSIVDNMNSTTGNTLYGFSENYDNHIMKNIEWGTMAYLSQSKYGKYGNTAYTGASKEIYKMIVLVIIQEEVLV